MNKFGIYIFQFQTKQQNKKILPNNTTMIGEVCMSSKEYKNLSIQEACIKRIKNEICPKHGLGTKFNELNLIDFIEISSPKNAGVDKDLHKILRELGYTQLKDTNKKGELQYTEMFNLGINPMYAVELAVKKYTGDIPRYKFVPRDIQKDCIKQIDDYFKTASIKQFLIFAVCRFGKTSTTLYTAINKLKKKNILILSSKCDVSNSWKEDFYKWDFTKGYRFITKDEIKVDNNILKQNNKVCFMSFQSAADLDKEITNNEFNRWCDVISANKWDLLIIDECHYGADTERSTKLINLISSKNKNIFKIELSATPYKKINEGKYTIENSFIYTLIDEDKKDKRYVPVKFYHLNVSNFKLDTKCMIENPAVKTFNQMADFYRSVDFCWDGFFSKFNDEDLSYIWNNLYEKLFKKCGSRHVAVVVKEIKQGKILYDAITKNNKYNVINLCGVNKIPLYEINQIIEENKKPTILISCSRYMTGTTITKLDSVIFMRDVHSAETYVQFMLRGKNWYENRKKPCLVFDLSPNTFVQTEAFSKLVVSEGKARNTSPAKIAKDYSSCISLFEVNNFDVIKPMKNFVADFEKNLYTIGSDIQRPHVDFYIENLLKNLPLSFAKFLMQKENEKFDITAINDIHKLKQKKKTKKKKEECKKKLNIEELKNKLIKVLAHLPTFMKYNKINDINQMFIESEKYDDLCQDMEYWTNGFTFEFLSILKDSMSEYEWNEFSKSLKVACNNLPENRDEWKYDAPRAVNNWKIYV